MCVTLSFLVFFSKRLALPRQQATKKLKDKQSMPPSLLSHLKKHIQNSLALSTSKKVCLISYWIGEFRLYISTLTTDYTVSSCPPNNIASSASFHISWQFSRLSYYQITRAIFPIRFSEPNMLSRLQEKTAVIYHCSYKIIFWNNFH